MFAAVHSLHAAEQDLVLVERACRRLHLRTGQERWAEQASMVREVLDGRSWVDRIALIRDFGPRR